MQVRIGNNWQETIWKWVTNPTIEVVAAIVVMLIAAWIVIDTDVLQKGTQQFPVLFGYK